MPKKQKNQTAENNIVDYQQLMRLIDRGDLKGIEAWVNKNKLKPAFNLNQSIKYKLLELKPIEWYCKKFHQCYKFSEQGHIFHLLSSYPEAEGISAVSSVNFEPFFIKGLLKNMEELKGKSSAFFQFSNDRGENLIHQVIRSPREWKLIQYIPELSRRGVNVNQLNNQDEPPIFIAVYLRYIEALHYLILAEANFSTTTRDGFSILDVAVSRGDQKIYQLIKDHAAQKTISIKLGAFLIQAAELGNIQLWKGLITRINDWELKIDLNCRHPVNGRTALMAAAHEGKATIVKYLLKSKADPRIQDQQGFNAFSHSLISGDDKTIGILLQAADQEILEQKTSNGAPILQLAVENAPNFITPLFERGVRVNVCNADGNNPFVIALFLNRMDAINLLIDHPDLDRTASMSYFDAAIRYCDSSVLSKLIASPKFRHCFDENQELQLYSLTIALNKKSHFEVLFNSNFDINIYYYHWKNIRHPLAQLVFLGKTTWIDWLLKNHGNKLEDDSITSMLEYATWVSDEKIALLCVNFFSDMRLQESSENQITSAYLTYLSCLCAKKGWTTAAIKLQPKLKLFTNSLLFKNYNLSLLNFLMLIAYLEGDNRNLKMNKSLLLCFDPLSLINQIPHLSNYDNKEGFDSWKKGLIASHYASLQESKTVMVSEIATEPFVVRFSPYSFFTQVKGLDAEQVWSLFKEVKEHKMKNKSLGRVIIPASESKNPKSISWFSGSLPSSHPQLFPVESKSTLNAYLFIPTSIQEDPMAREVLNKSRWIFNRKNGFKRLKGNLPIEIILQIDDNYFQFHTHFTYEITQPHTANRVLCFTLNAENKDEQEILYIAAYPVKDGLHHSRTHLPKKIKLVVSKADVLEDELRTLTF